MTRTQAQVGKPLPATTGAAVVQPLALVPLVQLTVGPSVGGAVNSGGTVKGHTVGAMVDALALVPLGA
eukprot:CAMPEP_0168492656 /NCGR_PEP_ID=MMETSP0228-20121227/70324_1 /TAXON_ID=133427 /ORGANISM="Protoceratium reticulatum, Strain CCCM 535 (=CCMP 1889)" /LENGTH=67 /DNA_ID=CAMNT_0008509431 /DNA_START=7 /DNA_END=206 /DNA_ORIENTATION=-